MTTEDPREQYQQRFAALQQQQEAQDAMHFEHMQILETKQAMENFLDGLSPEQCLNLSRMCQLFANNPNYTSVIIGQLAVYLRVVHKVCAQCGDPKHSTVDHLIANENGSEVLPVVADFGWLAGLTYYQQAYKLNVSQSEEESGAFICNNCDAVFVTLFHRAQFGLWCPHCNERRNWLIGIPDNKLDFSDLMTRYRVHESASVEDGVACLRCGTEFPTLKFRVEQGAECPACKIESEVTNDGPSESS